MTRNEVLVSAVLALAIALVLAGCWILLGLGAVLIALGAVLAVWSALWLAFGGAGSPRPPIGDDR